MLASTAARTSLRGAPGESSVQGAELGDRANALAHSQRFAQTILAVAIGARGIEIGNAVVGGAMDQTQGRGLRRLSRPVGRAIGEPQLNRPQHKRRRAWIAHREKAFGPV